MSRYASSVLIALGLAAGCVGPRTNPGGADALALAGVHVVDVASGHILRNVTVIVRGELIEAIVPSHAPTATRGLRTVDLSGRYVIPGLWDMHAHLSNDPSMLRLHLANGVTSVRDMGSSPDSTLAARRRVRAGALLGPTIYAAGPVVDGPKENALYRLTVRNADDGLRAVDSLMRLGVDVIKVHNSVPPEAYFALLRGARDRRIQVVGHVPFGVTLQQATDSGHRTVEHIAALLEVALPRSATAPTTVQQVDSAITHFLAEDAPALWQRFRANGTVFDPTLVAARGSALRLERLGATAADPRDTYVPPYLREFQERYFPRQAVRPPLVIEGRRLIFRRGLDIVRSAHTAGVLIVAGTDVGIPHVYPGFSIHDELALLVEAGLTPLEALRAGTLHAANVTGVGARVGTVGPGKVADMVVLERDPLTNIHNTQRIDAVVTRGRLLTRHTLDELLRQSADTTRGNAP